MEKEPGFFGGLVRKLLGMGLAAAVVGGGYAIKDAIDTARYEPEDYDSGYTETTATPDQTYNFDVGFSVTMAPGFAEQKSELNEFYGIGDEGAFAIICNTEPVADYESVEEYANLLAEANMTQALTDAAGNYYVSYVNAENNYHYYTVIRQGAENFYRVSFYTHKDNFSTYEAKFAQWANTVTVQ